MNSVLKDMLDTGQVSDGKEILPLRAHMDKREGNLLSKVVECVQPTTSLEVGFAYGVSTLYVCDSLAKIGKPARHIVLDPNQFSNWRGIGVRNVERAGYGRFVDFRQERSEIALPQLLDEKTVLDMAVIDGWHTFDHALVDLFYVNKMLRIGGVVVMDDSSMPSVGKLVDHVLTYGCYRIFGVPSDHGLLGWRLAYYARLKGSKWPSAIALEKIASDDRPWNWHRSF